jgi:hypothetical protein
MLEKCKVCNGNGAISVGGGCHGYGDVRCEACYGSGVVVGGPNAGFEGCVCLQDEHHSDCPAIATGKCHYQSYYPKPVGYDAASTQPKPTGNGQDVAVRAAEVLRNFGYDKIAEDIEARIRLGEKKYGTRLKSHNGRDAVLDLYQELLDSLNYAMQCDIEGIDNGNLFDRIANITIDVARLMADRAAAPNLSALQQLENLSEDL